MEGMQPACNQSLILPDTLAASAQRLPAPAFGTTPAAAAGCLHGSAKSAKREWREA